MYGKTKLNLPSRVYFKDYLFYYMRYSSDLRRKVISLVKKECKYELNLETEVRIEFEGKNKVYKRIRIVDSKNPSHYINKIKTVLDKLGFVFLDVDKIGKDLIIYFDDFLD